MGVLEQPFCVSNALITFCVLVLLFKSSIVADTSECSIYDFPCEDGGCVDSGLWCDSDEDCSDGSDEKYCKRSTWNNIDPNKCPSTYFKCKDGPCIPLVGRCDGYDDCNDNSDEKDCEQLEQTSKNSVTKNLTTTSTPMTENVVFNATSFFTSLNVSESTLQVEEFSGHSLSTFSVPRHKARLWLYTQRKSHSGWGDKTPRAITALYLTNHLITDKTNDMDMILKKDLDIQLLLELVRNRTKPMKLTDLGLYINALFVSCKNPKNFYGENLVSILRDGVNSAQIKDEFINPSIYLTLCGNNVTTGSDVSKLQDILLGKNSNRNKLDLQALAMLSAACIFRRTNYLNVSMYDRIKKEFLRNVKVHGFPGNIYEAALVFQALQEMKITLKGLTHFIMKQQQEDGSFGDMLSTYLVLPILAGRNMVKMYDYCYIRDPLNLIPLEVLKNNKNKKISISYNLNYIFPERITHNMQMLVKEGTSFFNVMRLAEEMNPKYRFKLSENPDVPAVYSIGGVPNDVEKGMYWTLYKASRNNTENGERYVPYQGDIKKLILVEGDEIMFYYKPL